MSHVCNVILTFGIGQDEFFKEVNRYFSEVRGRNEKPLVTVDDPSLPNGWYGGTKYLETEVAIGAFNYLHEEEFIAHLKQALEYYDQPAQTVQLFLKDEDDNSFRVITLEPD